VILTRQIVAICAHLGEPATDRTFRRVVRKLRDYKLVDFVCKNIGGRGQGFKVLANYWKLTKLGLEVAALDNHELSSRIRDFDEESEPNNPLHAVENTDVELVIRNLAKSNRDFKLTALEYETYAARRYHDGISGKLLKPDLFADTNKGSWFIETDRYTERAHHIHKKCLVYKRYFESTNPDEWRSSSMPLVAWAVPPVRRVRLEAYLDTKLDPLTRKLFRVVTKAELPELLLNGGRNG
jgi:hypothetical protein